MFKKLKDKIAEEVKSSPQRIQQLTQSVTERIQNATSDESFFSIGDDDAQSSSPNPEPGFSNVSLSSYSTPNSGHFRRNSNSSVASDMSFLPRYESATNLYHLQSDLDVSASEVEDNVSTSSQLGHLSKEQIYAAFQKAQMRYHKYRGRYTDIANHYKELERENSKMKSVLVETQDKALRRVAELREQCSLEQKAKAHLENALRVELDEKQYVIDTLKTKVNLLQTTIKNGDAGKPELLVNINDTSFSISDDPSDKVQNDNLDVLAKDLKDARIEIENLNGKLQEMKANAIILSSKEGDLKKKISDLEDINKHKAVEMSQVLERERENNLIIAQTKMELHTEIQNRDLEIENLKHDIESLKADLDQYESKPKGGSKLENFQSQNTKLIDKVEELTQKCNNYESELLKTEQLRIEIQNSNKAIEFFKERIKEVEAEKTSLEAKLQHQNSVNSNTEDLEAIKLHNDDLQKEIDKFKEIVAGHEKVTEEKLELQEQIKQQQTEYEGKIIAYREDTKKHLLTLESKIRDKIKVEFDEKEQKLTTEFHEKFQQLSKNDTNVKQTQLKLIETEEEVKNLKTILGTVEETLSKQQDKYKDLETNHLDLITENTNVRTELTQSQKQLSEMKDQLSRQESETGALLNDKAKIEQEYEKLQKECEDLQKRNRSLHDEKTTLQSENQILLSDKQNFQSQQSDSNVSLQNEIENLQLKMRNLEDDYEIMLNENTHLKQENSNIQNGKAHLQSENSNLKEENKNLQDKSVALEKEKSVLDKDLADTRFTVANTTHACEEFKHRAKELAQANDDFQDEISKKEQELSLLQQRITRYENDIQNTSNDNQKEITALREELAQVQMDLVSTKQLLEDTQKSKDNIQQVLERTKQVLQKKLKDQKTKFHGEIQSLNADISGFKEKNEMIQACIDEYKQKLNEYESGSLEKATRLQDLLNQNETIKGELVQFKKLLEDSKCENVELVNSIGRLEAEVVQKTNEVQTVQASFVQFENFQAENISLGEQLQKVLDENNNLKEQISVLQADASKNVTEITLHNENLKQRLEKFKSDCKAISAENNELKEQLEKLQETELNYKTQLSNVEVMEQKLQNEKLQLLNDNTELQTKIDDLNTEKQKLQDNVMQLREQLRTHSDILAENQQTKNVNSRVLEEVSELERRNNELSLDYKQISQENEGLLQELVETRLKFETLEGEKVKWNEIVAEKQEIQNELEECKNELEKLRLQKPNSQDEQDVESILAEHKSLKTQVNRLEEQCELFEKQKKSLEGQLRELENQYTEISHEKQLLQDEVQELKISPINITNHTSNAQKLENLDMIHAERILSLENPGDVEKIQQDHEKEINQLNEKLIQYKSLDLTNRSSIQFYENELQKLKNKNEKLNRKLDETLVTLNHCTELSHSTETEYLKNVLYNYMLGKEGLVLARVIAAVCKFDDNQTETILQREQQKQTLLGQLGFI